MEIFMGKVTQINRICFKIFQEKKKSGRSWERGRQWMIQGWQNVKNS